MNARRDRAARSVEGGARQSDRPTPRIRSDAAGWSTISPVDDQPSPLDDHPSPLDDRRGDLPRAVRRYADTDRGTASPRDDVPSRPGRADDDPDSEPRRGRGRYSDDEPGRAHESGSWRDHGDEPVRPYQGELRRGSAEVEEPRRSRRSIEEGPRRSRRAEEQAARRALRDSAEPRRLRSVHDELGLGLDPADEAPFTSEPASPPGWNGFEPSRRPPEYPDPGSGSSGFGTVGFGTRAIGSGETTTGARGRHADPAELETWRSETGTWRTQDTATTGSWRLPPSAEDVSPGGFSPDNFSSGNFSSGNGDFSSGNGDTGDRWAATTPETGSWSRSRGEWVPRTDDTGEQPDFSVRRYDDTGEIPKSLVQTASGRVLDYEDLYDAERRGGRRGADDDGADEGFGRRPVDRVIDDRPSRAADWSTTGGRGTRRALPSRVDDRDDDYRSVEEEPQGARSSRPRYDDDGPRYQDDGPRYRDDRPRYRDDRPRYEDGPRYPDDRRGTGGSRTGRHASDGYDDEDERPRVGTATRRAYAGPRGAADSVVTPRAGTGRGELLRGDRRPVTRPEEDADDAEEVAYGYVGAGFASVAWFGVPIGAFLLWAVLLGGTARAGCVDAVGLPCRAPRDAAFTTFEAHLPQVGVAIVLSVVVALLIRAVSPFWRAGTVGFASAVVGAGVTTVLFTVLNGA
ncbi:MAG TPA: hypothetical protein VGP31_03960 [Planosporangium sp.]|nr:hypothetical protein [Planosporangium sp.]